MQASNAGEIQDNGKKSVSKRSEIRFQIWYDDVLHKRTTFSVFPNFILRNIVKIMKQEASA